jgi:hypothetical protein
MTAPKLGTAGRTLWKAVLGGLADGWQLDERELELLGLACRQADDLSLLEAAIKREGVTSIGSTGQRTVHAAVPEARQARVTISRLLGQIELPDADEKPATAATTRSKKAAQARWSRKERLEAMRNG